MIDISVGVMEGSFKRDADMPLDVRSFSQSSFYQVQGDTLQG